MGFAEIIWATQAQLMKLRVKTDAALIGKTITASDGTKTVSGTVGADQVVTLILPHGGEWTVTEGYRGHSKKVKLDTFGWHEITLNSYTLYGYKITKGDKRCAVRVEYPSDCDNANFKSAYMDYSADEFNYGDWKDAFFMPRPCMVKNNGTVDYYLDPNDFTKKADGSGSSDVTNTSYGGNAMVEFPTIYFKRWEDSCYEYCYIADAAIDSSYKAFAHTDANGAIIPYCYMAIYRGSLISSKMRSLSGVSMMESKTAQQERDAAQSNGTSWDMSTFADRMMVNDLLVLIGKSTHTQKVFGYGNAPGSQSVQSSGKLDKYGMFYGTSASNGLGVKVFGIENYWGNQWNRLVGWVNVSGTQKIKLTKGTDDGSTASDYNFTGNGYLTISGATPAGTSGGYISEMKMTAYGRIPVNAAGGDGTFESDGFWFNNGQTDVAVVGGDSNGSAFCGAFASDLRNAASIAGWAIASSLSLKPLAS